MKKIILIGLIAFSSLSANSSNEECSTFESIILDSLRTGSYNLNVKNLYSAREGFEKAQKYLSEYNSNNCQTILNSNEFLYTERHIEEQLNQVNALIYYRQRGV